MPKIQLTDASVRALKIPPTGQVTYFDKNLPGFNVRVSQGGTKTYTVVYGTTRKRKTIGRAGIISLADARKEARKVIAEHTLGKVDPQTLSYESALQEFLSDSERINKPRTTKDYKRLLTTHFKYGRTPLGEITKQDIKHRLAKLNSTPSEKHHAFVAIRRFMRWALANQYIVHNPVDGISVKHQKARERVLTPDELKAVYGAASAGNTTFHHIVALLVLTGQRRGEIVSLKWEWIDGDAITLPETKGGRAHRFPLGKMARKVISKIPQASAYVFPASVSQVRGQPTTTFNGWSKAKAAFDKELDIDSYTLHDLRRTFATTLAMLGTPIHITERLLNHVSGTYSGVVGVYQRYSYMDEMREALRGYEDWLASL